MEKYKLGEMEQKFADLIWENEPISSRRLTELCEKAFSWKRTTTYTMLKRLCERAIFQNESGTVTSLLQAGYQVQEEAEVSPLFNIRRHHR